jgi:hypothetical protein
VTSAPAAKPIDTLGPALDTLIPPDAVVDPPSRRGLRIAAIAAVGLVAVIALISLNQRNAQQELSKQTSDRAEAGIMAQREAAKEVQRLERDELAKREARTYAGAHANIASLRDYTNDCDVCAFKDEAIIEIARLEQDQLARQEEAAYRAARGNLSNLREYARTCKVCDFRAGAENEISQLERTIAFRIKSNHPKAVALSFYSQRDKSRAWEGGILRDSQPHDYRLSCDVGETICYGAWVNGNALSPYWGTGYGGREWCTNCCHVCSGQETDPIVLNPSDAKVPVPTLTWQVQNNYSYIIDLVFYAADRPNQWPGGNQVYTLNDRSVHNIRISCQANEIVCYGAWPRGNPGSIGWGLGYNRGLGCSNCCWRCNGGETGVISINP